MHFSSSLFSVISIVIYCKLQLDIVCQNKLPQERGIISIDTLITRLAINKTGTWMATVEERNDPNLPEQRLKFWFFNSTKQKYVLKLYYVDFFCTFCFL